MQSDSSNGISKAGPAEIPGCPRGLVTGSSGHSDHEATPEPLGPQTAAAKERRCAE